MPFLDLHIYFCSHEEASMRITAKFYDDKNFKRGFSRSGFTIREAMILETYGRTMQSLLNDEFLPESDDEKGFVEQIHNQSGKMSEFAQCWLKYQNKINFKPKYHTLCSSHSSAADDMQPDDID